MGLFSKKTYVCERCGKEFQKRINLNGNFCDECLDMELKEKRELKELVGGYYDYGFDVLLKDYTSEELKEIISHRDMILNIYRNRNGITREELEAASENYKELSDDEAGMILARVIDSTLKSTRGAVYTNTFFCPTQYSGIVVDAKDVFAVGYTSDSVLSDSNCDAVLCAVFTNDPYIPVFPMVFLKKKGLFEFGKSKYGRLGVEMFFGAMCPELTYPVCDIKQLKKQIKQEGVVKGNVDTKFMLDKMSDATYGTGMFNTKNMFDFLCGSSLISMLKESGFYQQKDIDEILRLDKHANRKYWDKQIEKIYR